jgi:hypothetical protein
MLTASQCEIVAYATDGEIVCRDCAIRDYGELSASKADEGLVNAYDLSPLIRYSIDEYNGERVYEEANERIRDWRYDHPVLAELLLDDHREWRLADRIVDRLGDTFDERCGSCGEVI